MTRAVLAIAALLALSTLGATCVPPPPAPPVPTTADCAGVCSRWRDLGCQEGNDTPDGESCEAVCGLWERYWDLQCMSAVATCDELEACG